MDLPSTIPLFPLPNVVLFPGVPLPLYIFEPRYRQMIKDVQVGHQLVGMVLMREVADVGSGPRMTYEIGCAGKLVNVDPMADGRSNILLHGFREFRIRREIDGQPYRQADVEWLKRAPSRLDRVERARLVDTLRAYLSAEPGSPAHKVLAEDSLADEVLVNFFSYALDIAPLEKQALLEESSLTSRASRLCEVAEFAAHTGGAQAPGKSGQVH